VALKTILEPRKKPKMALWSILLVFNKNNKMNKFKKIVFWILMSGIVFGVGYILSMRLSEVKYKAEPEAPKIENKINDELQRIIDEENFRKATFLRARVVANDRKKAEEIARNKRAMEAIETEYETIRQEELLLVGTTTSSLK